MLRNIIQERLQDIMATKLAESVFNEIVYHKTSEVEGEVRKYGTSVDFNTPDGIKLDSYEEPFNLTLVRSDKSSHYVPLQQGNDLRSVVITIQSYGGNYIDFLNDFIRQLVIKKSSFIHEFIHMLDDIRSNGVINIIPKNRVGGQEEYEVFNREVNARFHQMMSKIRDEYFYKELGQLKKDWYLKKNKEGTFGEYLSDNAEYVCNIGYLVQLFKDEIPNFFYYRLSSDLEKKLVSRAYTYFEELQKEMGIECEKKGFKSLMETYQFLLETTGDWGYHAGNLKVKAETLSDRGYHITSTGQMGTGHYFYGSLKDAKKHANQLTAGKIGENSVYKVDFSKYNLFKPSNPSEFYDGLVVPLNNQVLKYMRIEDFDDEEYLDVLKDAADFYRSMGVHISDEDFISISKEFVNDLQSKGGFSNDMFNTRILKRAGYEGVDVRGTSLDNFAVGSVIFDIKDGTYKKV